MWLGLDLAMKADGGAEFRGGDPEWVGGISEGAAANKDETFPCLIARQCPELALEAYRRAIEPLVREDQVSGTDLIRTVAACLDASSRAEAACVLHLHRNSLSHRLEKVRKLVDRDPFDRSDGFLMRIGLAALAVWPHVAAMSVNR